MRFGRTAAMVTCAALVGAVPASAMPVDGDPKTKQCKPKQHKRFVCERIADETVVTTCPDGYSAVVFHSAPDADVNDNSVVCYSESLGVIDDTP